MSDLISRSETYKELINRIDWLREQDYGMYCCIGDCIQDTLAKQPTAYDIGKVVEELETNKQNALEVEESIKEYNVWNKAIEIVKQEAEQCNNGWIACSERLPEKNGMYLCTQNSYDLATNKNIIRVSTELVEFYNGKWRRAKNLVVTHWQPLPEPFKERD